jgi:hypothetical protein
MERSDGMNMDAYKEKDGLSFLRAVADEVFNCIEVEKPRSAVQHGSEWRRMWFSDKPGMGKFWFCWQEPSDHGVDFMVIMKRRFERALAELKANEVRDYERNETALAGMRVEDDGGLSDSESSEFQLV